MGATFRVEGSGSLVFGGTFRNVGGTADLTGGGQLAINGTLAGFEHGASPGPTTVRSTVVGGAVRMTVGTLRPTEGGPGAFRWGPDDLAVLDGTLRADQSIEAHCADNSYSYLRLAAGARNEGTIRLLPAARGTTCLTYFYPLAEFTNAGALVFGDGSVTGAAFQIGNAGRVLNEAAGSIEVDGTVANFVPITNDGTVTVRPGGRIDNYNRTFDHRNGVIANAGTFAMGSVGPLFRSQAGAVTGNPVTLLAGRLELVGAGAASFLVPASNGATLADGSGRALIRPQHHLIVEGLLATEVPAENRGEVTLTGDGSGNAIFGTSGGSVTRSVAIWPPEAHTCSPGQAHRIRHREHLETDAQQSNRHRDLGHTQRPEQVRSCSRCEVATATTAAGGRDTSGDPARLPHRGSPVLCGCCAAG